MFLGRSTERPFFHTKHQKPKTKKTEKKPLNNDESRFCVFGLYFWNLVFTLWSDNKYQIPRTGGERSINKENYYFFLGLSHSASCKTLSITFS